MAEETVKVTETVTSETPTVETDEDYKWLTDRLDAHTTALTELRNLMQSQMEAQRMVSESQLSETRTLIQSLTEMVKTQSESLTALAAASALSKLTPQTLPITSQVIEPPTPAVEVVEPAAPEVTQESHAEPAPEKRRRFQRL